MLFALALGARVAAAAATTVAAAEGRHYRRGAPPTTPPPQMFITEFVDWRLERNASYDIAARPPNTLIHPSSHFMYYEFLRVNLRDQITVSGSRSPTPPSHINTADAQTPPGSSLAREEIPSHLVLVGVMPQRLA
ncbi:unnamed protein product [Mesocestoides corti]|uniref:Secreted protein n=1 Tax=Mesocestoides corti TaxID=53468 RepID=A0A0R3UGF7_MESCO|nr:unnamed protein product [Mesocestoides corti]